MGYRRINDCKQFSFDARTFIQYVLTNIDYFDDVISLDFGLEFLSFDLYKSQTAVAAVLLVHGTRVVKI